jgi:hypothetical protein
MNAFLSLLLPCVSPGAPLRGASIAVGCILAAALTGCPNTPPGACYGLAVGSRIQLSVIEPYGPNSDFTYSSQVTSMCDDGLDLAAGQTIEADVIDLRGDNSCLTAIAQFSSVDGWTWQLKANQDPASGLFLYGLYQASLGACTGTLEIQVSADTTPFAPETPGQAPHVVLTRSFTADATNPACPDAGTVIQSARSCVGQFVVSANKL